MKGRHMATLLHLLRSEPDETIKAIISALGQDEGATVVSLYPDAIAPTPVDWPRLIDDIFDHDSVICWW